MPHTTGHARRGEHRLNIVHRRAELPGEVGAHDTVRHDAELSRDAELPRRGWHFDRVGMDGPERFRHGPNGRRIVGLLGGFLTKLPSVRLSA